MIMGKACPQFLQQGDWTAMKRRREKGFTLIEVIVSLILLGIVSAIAGMGFVTVARGYVFAKLNAEMVEKGQTAITRMVKELSNCTVTAGNATSVTFTRQSDGTTHTVSWAGAGNPLVFTDTNDTLTDNVSNFGLVYRKNDGNVVTATDKDQSQIEITIELIAADGSTHPFISRVYTKTQ
jgi:prepilin-type N-terminal cleavage/methylation domain-containing protein